MAILAQVDANRRNAFKSTGPKTEQGKAVGRANATGRVRCTAGLGGRTD